jgi:ABC-type multidrug transport system permease subunit
MKSSEAMIWFLLGVLVAVLIILSLLQLFIGYEQPYSDYARIQFVVLMVFLVLLFLGILIGIKYWRTKKSKKAS